jgi:hypothetical protein
LQARLGAPPRGFRLAATQVKEAFFGDIDDKYLPAFHSLRLVLRAGANQGLRSPAMRASRRLSSDPSQPSR